MLKNNYHTHTALCKHADGMVIDYVNKANELGIKELGMSDHAPIPTTFMTPEEYESNWAYDTMSLEEIDLYLKQIEDCRKQYPNMKIYSGFETEFVESETDYYKTLRSKVDYLNLGMHYYQIGTKIINCYTDVNYDNVENYLIEARKALSTGLFTTLVHPDIFMYEYKDKNGNWVFDEKCEAVTRGIAELALEYDVYLEVNCNGLKYCKDKYDRATWLYPYPKFWEIIKEYPVKILIGADAHKPESLGDENVRLACKFAEDLGLNISEKMVLK